MAILQPPTPPPRPRPPTIAGIFVGGRSRRMGGRPKGNLVLPSGETLVSRWRALFDAARVPVVLVGRHEAYASEGLAVVDDAPLAEGIELGPLGGLVAFLRHAGARHGVAVACDMPFVSPELLQRLLTAPAAAAVAPRVDGRWEPFFARYDAAAVEPVAMAHAQAHRLALKDLLDAVSASELPLAPSEAAQLADWDTPEDAGL